MRFPIRNDAFLCVYNQKQCGLAVFHQILCVSGRIPRSLVSGKVPRSLVSGRIPRSLLSGSIPRSLVGLGSFSRPGKPIPGNFFPSTFAGHFGTFAGHFEPPLYAHPSGFMGLWDPSRKIRSEKL